MRNLRRDGDRFEFAINGQDATLSYLVIGVVLLALLAALCLAWIGLREESWLFALAPLLLMFPFLIGVLRLMGSGRLARYRLVIDRAAGSVTAEDRRGRKTLWSAPFDPGRLYLSRIRVQVGYVSALKDVLVYGDPVQDVVEDGVPSERTSVLTIAPRPALEELLARLGKSPDPKEVGGGEVNTH
jgi:hypothetical protein